MTTPRDLHAEIERMLGRTTGLVQYSPSIEHIRYLDAALTAATAGGGAPSEGCAARPVSTEATAMNDPERDPWPSVDDRDGDETCPHCDVMPDEEHQPDCPLATPSFDRLAWCDRCGQEYATVCACDGAPCCEDDE